jgi:hypothetical protein
MTLALISLNQHSTVCISRTYTDFHTLGMGPNEKE